MENKLGSTTSLPINFLLKFTLLSGTGLSPIIIHAVNEHINRILLRLIVNFVANRNQMASGGRVPR